MDELGNVVGVVAMQANETVVLQRSGALPQNVNYAIKSAFALALTDAVPDLAAKLKVPRAKPRSGDQVVEDAQSAAALILVY